MAKGFDDIKNGLIFGALAGALLYFAAANVADASWINWFATAVDNGSTWLLARDWMSGLSSISVTVMSYILAMLSGAIVGGIIDKS